MSYDPERIRHVSGQNKKTEDLEKAQEMAKRANPLMSFATDYDKYLVKPPEQKPPEQDLFALMEQKGITSDYIRAIADLHAENTGASYDYSQEVLDMTQAQLLNENNLLVKEILNYETHPYVHVKRGPATERDSNFAVETGMKPIKESEYLIKADIVEHQRMDRIVSKLVILGREIKRRKPYLSQQS